MRKAAESLGYIPNAQAQGLAKSSSGLIGLIVHDIADPYFSAIARGVQDAAREQGKMVLLATTGGTPAGRAGGRGRLRRATGRLDSDRRVPLHARRRTRTATPSLRPNWTGTAAMAAAWALWGIRSSEPQPPRATTWLTVPNEELAAELARELAANHAGEFVIVAGPEGLMHVR